MSLPSDFTTIKEARSKILSAIGDNVTLVAASKRQSEDRINAALATGQRVFGENRVQEAQKRWAPLKSQFEKLELRLIGPLQTNKAAEAIELFDVIETLDRPKLLSALIKALEKTERAPPDLLIQVNTGDERQKSGVSLAEFDDFLKLSRQDWPGKIAGLMCIPPASEPAAPHFAFLKRLADENNLPHISMGMSSDYALAAKLGASHVRVGTALFGARD